MLKIGLAGLAVAAVATMTFTAPADAQSRRYRYSGDGYQYGYQYQGQSQYADRVRQGRPDPNSYDGRRTGNPRTCGYDFFRYDNRGVPSGPYCN
jgi:hypothetical protein